MLAHLATTAEDASDLRRELPHAGGLGGSSALRRPYQRARPISRPRPVAAALLRDVLCAEALRGQQVLEAPGCDAAAVAGSARHFLTGLRETAKAGGTPAVRARSPAPSCRSAPS